MDLFKINVLYKTQFCILCKKTKGRSGEHPFFLNY